MRFSRPQDEAPVELVDALKGDGAAFLAAQRLGDLFPGLPSLALFANKIHKRLEPAMVGATAAGSD